MTMKGVRLAVLAAALIMAGTTAQAQQGPGQTGGQYRNEGSDKAPGRGEPDAKKREEVRKKIETVRMWRLTEELKLDEKTSARLASFLSALDEKRRGLMHERMEAMGDLRTLLKTEKPDEKKLKTDLDKLEKTRREMVELEGKEISGIRDILSVEQQARYVIFQQEFRREMRGMIAEARGGGQGTRGPGSRRNEGPGPDRTPSK
jgi:Spy/CpxP family protein refolding chaperone